jgi:CheY-like chemotaxis protein
MSAPRGQRHGWRIIVTDDDPDKLYHLTKPLRSAGHCVFAAYDGASALELVVQLQHIDLLITNTRLGIEDGATLMRETRRLRPHLPILHVSHERAEAGITPPGVPILNEPFTPTQLLHAVASLLTLDQQARRI